MIPPRGQTECWRSTPSMATIGSFQSGVAVLIRPDGYVAWVADGTDTGLRDALATWFG
jgi:3-(3-hydroxy-phenyl)propionate hydroxylase